MNLDNKSVNDTLTAELERYKEQVKVLKEGQNVDLNSRDNISDSCEQSIEIECLKQTLSEQLKEKESLMQTVTLLKNDFKKEESRNIDREISLEKKIKQLDNIFYKRDQSTQIVHMLTKPHTIAIMILDSKETLMLAEESRSKILLKQQDPMVLENKVNTTPVDYVNYMNSSDPSPFCRLTKVEVPKELPKVSMVNTSLKKLKHHLAGFDVVVKERTTNIAITEGSWGFEHTKACFRDEIIPFVKVLKDIFNTFDQYLIDELTKVQNVFHQMEQVVEQHSLESKMFEVKMNQVLNENERLLEQVINKDIVNIIMNSIIDNASVNMHECKKCLKLETKLLNQKDFIEKETYDKLFRSYTTLEKHCISLEVDTQLNQEIFQRENSISNQSAPNFDQYFELNKLKAQSQEKDMVIRKLKERIKSLSGNMKDKTYKQLYDSIKPTRIRSKEQCDALINQVNQKSVEISDLNVSLQEKGLVITALKDELRKLKGKYLADNIVTKHTIAPEMLKFDVEPIVPKLLNNRTAHSNYLRYTQEQAAILREVVKQEKSQNPLNNSLDFALAVTPKNKDKRVRFTEPVTSLGNTNTKIASSSNLVSKKPMLSFTGVKLSTSASGSQPSGNTKKEKIQQTPSNTQKNKCNGYMLSDNNDLCVLNFINDVNACAKSKSVKKSSKRRVWKPTRKVFTKVGYTWRPTSQTFTIVGNAKPRKSKTNVLVSKHKIIKSISSNNKEPSQSWGSIVSDVPSSSIDECRSSKLFSVKFGNDYVEKIMGYGDYQIGNVTISRVYYVEGLRHNLFSVGQFCDSNLEVAFHQHTCFIRNLEGADLLTGSRGNNMYTLSLRDMMASSPISRHSLVRGLSKLKFEKDQLCYVCAMGKIKKKPHKPKYEDTNQEKLYLLHMDLYGPMRVASVNGKKYIVVIVDDFSRFTWLKCLRSKDEALNFIIKFLKDSYQTLLLQHLVAPALAESIGSPSSTTVDQDAPSPSNSQTLPETQSPVISIDVKEENHDLDVAHINNDPFFGILILENDFESSSSDVIHTVVQTAAPNAEHVNKWTKDCPLDNIIGELERLVSTRLQLHEQALFCYYDAFLTSVEPKTYKDALTQSC
ncbi:retrovirus-related pol polyprotein from transposon TNT 1-94 [Tanacetum coccineum]